MQVSAEFIKICSQDWQLDCDILMVPIKTKINKSKRSLCATGNHRISALQRGLDVPVKCHLLELQLHMKQGDSPEHKTCVSSLEEDRGRGQAKCRQRWEPDLQGSRPPPQDPGLLSTHQHLWTVQGETRGANLEVK